MAQRVQVVLEDDIDGSQADETIRFSVDGVDYEIDLSEKNAAKFRNAIGPWLGNARRVAGRKRGQSRPQRGSATDIRAWASEQGMTVNARGRVPSEVREAYERAHS
ncbi:hypothetical protein CGZ93_06820 [Enemella dayhoffiae]|uniref:Lsr2 family protein n=1 Tax=Enemella dayhoffiae TaxID=2016507 RepID=A0A255H4Z6_9ACTN|nr:Lsr2 family protein [Enemella dayhoffiae]OYO22758.1 hypothetical protein CGZ93_06820 [Enemella dayhoffiae]